MTFNNLSKPLKSLLSHVINRLINRQSDTLKIYSLMIELGCKGFVMLEGVKNVRLLDKKGWQALDLVWCEK